MKHGKLAVMAVLALMFTMAIQFHRANLVSANPLQAPEMAIISPLPVTYQDTSVPLNFGANVLTGDPEVVFLRYSIDGEENVTITDVKKTGQQNFAPNETGFTYHIGETVTLTNLEEGNHTLWVYSHDADGKEMSGSLEFTVDTHNPADTYDPTAQPENTFNPQNLMLFITIGFAVAALLLASILLYRKKAEKTTK